MQTVQEIFKPIEGRSAETHNYASTLSHSKPEAPYFDVPLLGYKDQSTIHFHCGIKNNFSSVVEGGLILNDSLDQNFAVQPHLIHSNDIVEGLTKVGLEKLDKLSKGVQSGGLDSLWNGIYLEVPGTLLDVSKIKTSIDYEVANLRQISQAILATNNPNLKQLHVTFSNGGYVFKEALKHLTPEERETIIVITTGTTEIIEKDLAHVVYNIIGDKDWPSQICNGGMSGIEAAKDKAEIRMVSQTETKPGLGGHFFMQPDYQKSISETIKNEINEKYEVY